MPRPLRLAPALFVLLSILAAAPSDTFAKRRAAIEIPEIPEAFADAPAIVLYDGSSLHVAPKLSRTHFWTRRRVLIQTEDGLDQANQVYRVPSRLYEITDVDARLYPPGGGRPERIDDEFVHVHTVVRVGREGLEEAVEITYPGATVGSVVEYTLELKSDDVVHGAIWPAQDDIPRLRTTFVARASMSPYEFHTSSFARNQRLFDEHCEWEEPNLEGRVPSRRLVCTEVPAYVYEPYAPAEADTRLFVDVGVAASTFNLRRFWDLNKAWLSFNIAAYLEVDEAVEKVIEELSETPEFERDRVDAIQRWMKDNLSLDPEGGCALLYIGADGERHAESVARYDEGDVCRTAGEVVEARSGDAWELTFAEVALLREAGIASYFAQAVDRRRGEYFRRAPFEQVRRLTHPLVMIREEDGVHFRDATCAECPRGMMPWYLKGDGSAVFPISPWSRTPIPLAASPSSGNVISMHDVLTVSPDGQARCEGRTTWTGDAEISMRQSFKRAEDDAELERRRAASIGFDASQASIAPLPPDSEHGFGLSYQMDATDEIARLLGRLLVPPPPMPSAVTDLPVADERVHPVLIGYGRTISTQREVVVPDGFVVEEMPPPYSIEEEGLTYDASWAQVDDGRVAFTSRLVLDRDRYEVDHYPALRDALLSIEDFLRGKLILAPSPARDRNTDQESTDAP